MKKIIVITGCTATGKSALSVALAKRINGEIISADSMQIYRGMDIGTAKITKDEADGVIHKMIDCVDPTERFTVADYQKTALKCIDEIFEKGKVPIICGGTGLYINSLLYKMNFSSFDEDLKSRVSQMAKEMSKEELWNYLYSLDRERAEQLSQNDTKRVSRAIEIALSNSKSKEDETQIKRFDAHIYILNGDRQEIYQRINKRVDIMIENGLVDEVKNLLDSGISFDSQAIQGIGYKEIASYINGEYSLYEAVETVKQKSRNYAKRQLTWFKRYYPEAKYLDYKTPLDNVQTIVDDYYGK